jgi:tRNA pseudouridine38-40 synthase
VVIHAGAVQCSAMRCMRALRSSRCLQRGAVQVHGSGFLYKMVRHMAGALLAVGRGRLQPSSVARMLEVGSSVVPGALGGGSGAAWLHVGGWSRCGPSRHKVGLCWRWAPR